MTIDSLLTDLFTSNWLLNNCYQLDDLTFRVSLRRPTPTGAWFSEWAEGPTLADALEECMSKLLDAEFHTEAPSVGYVEPTVSLIEALGLKPKLPPILRRI